MLLQCPFVLVCLGGVGLLHDTAARHSHARRVRSARPAGARDEVGLTRAGQPLIELPIGLARELFRPACETSVACGRARVPEQVRLRAVTAGRVLVDAWLAT